MANELVESLVKKLREEGESLDRYDAISQSTQEERSQKLFLTELHYCSALATVYMVPVFMERISSKEDWAALAKAALDLQRDFQSKYFQSLMGIVIKFSELFAKG